MYLHRKSPAGERLFACLRTGLGLKTSARAAGISKETARRWVREVFNELRADGLSVLEARASIGWVSSLMPAWDRQRSAAGDGRHHLRRPTAVEAAFWAAFEGRASIATATELAGVGRSTGYRWVQRRFLQLREDQVPVRRAARVLRLDADAADRWEKERLQAVALAQK